jgi:hypothetical protein
VKRGDSLDWALVEMSTVSRFSLYMYLGLIAICPTCLENEATVHSEPCLRQTENSVPQLHHTRIHAVTQAMGSMDIMSLGVQVSFELEKKLEGRVEVTRVRSTWNSWDVK